MIDIQIKEIENSNDKTQSLGGFSTNLKKFMWQCEYTQKSSIRFTSAQAKTYSTTEANMFKSIQTLINVS